MLTNLWPDQGQRCIFTANASGVKRHLFFAPGVDPSTAIKTLDDRGFDVWFAPATFTHDSRKGEHVARVKSFWLDMDCGEGKDYATQKDALRALIQWLGAAKFHVPRYIVSSGYGLHVYWLLSSSVTAEEWVPVATRFKAALHAMGLRADPARTADRASVMRIPGTHNHKRGGSAPVVVLFDSKRAVSLEDFALALPQVGPVAVASSCRIDSKFAANTEFPPADAALIAGKCAQMRLMKTTGGVGPEPWWRAGLSVLVRCVDGERLVAEWSSGDPRFDPAEATDKARRTGGPATCAHFADCNPDGCKGCPFYGKITSPIVLGTEAPAPEPEPEVTPEGAPNPYADRIDSVGPFKVTARGVILRTEDDEGNPVQETVTGIPLWVLDQLELERRETEADAVELLIRWKTVHGETRGALLPGEALGDMKAFSRWLGQNGIYPYIFDMKATMQFISAMTREVLATRRATRQFNALGWFDSGFVLGDQLFTDAGGAPAAVRKGSPLADIKPRGDAEQWKAAAAVLGKPENWVSAFTLLASMGSPVLAMAGGGGKQGAVLSLHGESGLGKSVSAGFAVSLYGDYTRFGQSPNTTYKALEEQLARLRHLPHFIDEAGKMRADVLGDYIYAAANGMGRQGLTRTRELREAGRWQLVSILTTNDAVLDRGPTEINEAQQKRVLELSMADAPLSKEDARILVDARDSHHGSAAGAYLTALWRAREMLPALFTKAEAIVNGYGAISDTNRFAVWTMAAAMVGGWIAKAAGVISWSPEDSIKRVAALLADPAYNTKSDAERFIPVVNELLTVRNGDVVYWNTDDKIPPIETPRSVIARVDRSAGRVFILASELQFWLKKNNVSLSNLRALLAKHDAKSGSKRLAPGAGPTWAYGIPLALLDGEGGDCPPPPQSQ